MRRLPRRCQQQPPAQSSKPRPDRPTDIRRLSSGELQDRIEGSHGAPLLSCGYRCLVRAASSSVLSTRLMIDPRMHRGPCPTHAAGWTLRH